MPSDIIKQKRNDLQNLVGEHPTVKVDDFINWGKTVRRNEILACYPESLDHIQALVRGCRQLGIRIRAAGAGHSWSPLFSDEGQLVMYTKDLKRHDGPQIELLQNPENDNDKHVTVMTNVTTGELMDFQLSHGICLPCNAVLRSVTYGGIVVTGCHGVGRQCKSVSDYVTAMRIVDSDGNLRSYSIKEDGPDMMKAVQTNLGLFGIVYDLTLKVNPMSIVEVKTDFVSVDKAFYDKDYIKQLMTNNESVELLWFPFNGIKAGEAAGAFFERDVDCGEWDPLKDEVWVRAVNTPEKPGEVKPPKYYDRVDLKQWLQVTLGGMVANVIVTNPGLTPTFARTQFGVIKKQNSEAPLTQQLPHAVHFLAGADKLPVNQMEWSIDFDEDVNSFCRASQYVVERLRDVAAEGKFPVNVAMEVRLMNHSDIYLSPAQAGNPARGGSGYTFCIEIMALAGTDGWDEFSDEVGKMWMSLPGARPHWSKEWAHLTDIDNRLRKMYSAQFPKFLDQLNKSKADPDGIFFNERLELLMYPKGHKGWQKVQAKSTPDEKNVTEKPKSKTCILF